MIRDIVVIDPTTNGTRVQTFLPYADFDESMHVLDNKRLQKQSVETYQILLALLDLGPVRDENGVTTHFTYREAVGWKNHPMTRMWRGYEYALLTYQDATIAELRRRPTNSGAPRKTTVGPLSTAAYVHGLDYGHNQDMIYDLPPWLGDERVHSTHRGNLIRKDPVWYGQWGWTESPQLGYFWPNPADYLRV